MPVGCGQPTLRVSGITIGGTAVDESDEWLLRSVQRVAGQAEPASSSRSTPRGSKK